MVEFSKILKENMYAILVSLGLVFTFTIIITILYRKKITVEASIPALTQDLEESNKEKEKLKNENTTLQQNEKQLLEAVNFYEAQAQQARLMGAINNTVETMEPVTHTDSEPVNKIDPDDELKEKISKHVDVEIDVEPDNDGNININIEDESESESE